MVVATVAGCHRYPVKSLQGLSSDSLELTGDGVVGDRTWALVAEGTATVLSAKSVADLLHGSADDRSVHLPDGTEVAIDDPAVHRVLSDWLGRPVRLADRSSLPVGEDPGYEMTFDPPDDTAEMFRIPVPAGTFVDLAPVHLVATATLEECSRLRPDLDWDVRRFRPNMLLDAAGEVFVEDSWVGRELAVGDEVVVRVDQPTVRCAMPLRPQPGLDRQVELYRAMTELHPAAPNHLGVYASVVRPGRVDVGDSVRILD